MYHHGPLTRYVKLWVAHEPGMPERFPRHRFQRKSLVSGSGMHHGTCVTHVPWCMSGSLTREGGENVPGIPSACATRSFTYLARGPLWAAWNGGKPWATQLQAILTIHDNICPQINGLVQERHWLHYWPSVGGIRRGGFAAIIVHIIKEFHLLCTNPVKSSLVSTT